MPLNAMMVGEARDLPGSLVLKGVHIKALDDVIFDGVSACVSEVFSSPWTDAETLCHHWSEHQRKLLSKKHPSAWNPVFQTTKPVKQHDCRQQELISLQR